MNASISIVTARGAKIEIDTYKRATINGNVNDKRGVMDVGYSRGHASYYIELSGKVTALVSEQAADAVRAFFIEIDAQMRASAEAWIKSDAGSAAALEEKMYGRNARYSEY